jgi:hypothetical protein
MCLNETYSKVCVGQHFSDMIWGFHSGDYEECFHFSDNFPIQNGLKQGYDSASLFFIFPLEYSVRKIKENLVGPKLMGHNQLLVYAYVNLLENNIDSTK